jgi:4-amino-4-deoxychorismate lyase
VKDGIVLHLPEHQLRVDRTFNHFFPGIEPINLDNILPDYPDIEKHKLRIVYDASEYTTQITPYENPSIKSLQPVTHNTISYAYKSLDRVDLATLWDKRGKADDIMIIRNGLVTDSYYANLAFYRNGLWYTPKSPLLQGVKRQVLLEQGSLTAIDIPIQTIKHYTHISLINAMLDLEEVVMQRLG